jgi:type IV pilus assembly protein PilW
MSIAMSTAKRGFTLIELMIALLLGTILVLGIASIFTNTTNNIRLQRGIANIQETGRFAMDRISDDVSGAGSQYCSAINTQLSDEGYTPPRPITSFIQANTASVSGNDELSASYSTSVTANAAVGTFYGLPGIIDIDVFTAAAVTKPEASPEAFRISPSFFIRGHDCVGNTCTPAVTALGGGRTTTGLPAAPATAGLVNGNRVPGTDVLTVRTLVGNGASISGYLGDGTINFQADYQARLGIPTARLGRRLAMVADCSQAALYFGDFTATSFKPINAAAPAIPVQPIKMQVEDNPRVFDLENQWLTVTYWLQYVTDPNRAGRVIPSLFRRENGRAAEEIARGVERLDFRYLVRNNAATSVWLNAAQVDSRNGGAIPCAKQARDAVDNACLWSTVTAVEVGFLANTIDDIAQSEKTLTYSMENQNAVASPAGASTLRREFRFTVPVKSWAQ